MFNFFKIKQSNFLGFIFGIAGYTVFVLLDSLIKKYLVHNYPIFQINFFICLFSFIPIIATLQILKSWHVLINKKIHIQLLRGILGLISGAIIVNSFKFHSFNEIYPILFSAPLILTVFSFFFLGEKVGPMRWTAVIIGFVGVLIVSRPGSIHFTWALFGCFFVAITIALNIIIIRKFANTQSSIAFAFYGVLAGLIGSGIITSQNYVIPTKIDFIIFIICGLLAGIATLCISEASKLLESSIFAPIQYSQLLSGFIFGYLFFMDIPDKYEIIGSIIIVISGLFVFYRESNLGLRPFLKRKTRIRDFFFRLH